MPEIRGFYGKDDRYLITVLKQIGFLDDSGTPTDRWRQFRDKGQASTVLAQSIRTCYADLFEAFPDAPTRDTETIRNYISAKTDAAEVTVGRMVGTFRALASLANFDLAAGSFPVGNGSSSSAVPADSARLPGATIPGRTPPIEEGMEQFVSEGILIRIKPTPENVRRAIKFLRIYADDTETQ